MVYEQFDIFQIYHEVNDLLEMWINVKMSHAQALVKKHEGQIEDKPRKSLEEMLPEELLKYKDVFSEEGASRFPKDKLWNHKILLKEDFQPK